MLICSSGQMPAQPGNMNMFPAMLLLRPSQPTQASMSSSLIGMTVPYVLRLYSGISRWLYAIEWLGFTLARPGNPAVGLVHGNAAQQAKVVQHLASAKYH